MNRVFVLLGCLLASCAATDPSTRPAAAPATTAAWQSLHTGKTLDAWRVVGSAIWSAPQPDVILGTQGDDAKRSGMIVTRNDYQDFELELDFQIDEHGKYNSGVYLRCQPGQNGRVVTGYQVNIGRGAAAEFCGGVFVNNAWLARGDEKDAIRKPNEWNRLRIVAKGAKLIVDLNGVNVVDVTDPNPDPRLLKAGSIALQTYGAEGHAGWVKFRNVRVRPL